MSQLEAEKPDEAHAIRVEQIENDRHVTMEHLMVKKYGISLLGYVITGRAQVVKLYPDPAVEAWFPMAGPG